MKAENNTIDEQSFKICVSLYYIIVYEYLILWPAESGTYIYRQSNTIILYLICTIHPKKYCQTRILSIPNIDMKEY